LTEQRPPGPDQRFPRALRLRKRPEFLRVQRRGRRTKTRDLVVCWAEARTDGSRFGFTVSRKVGTAVVRNRVKRWLREAVRRQPVHPRADIVFIAKSSAAKAGFHEIDRQVTLAVQRIARMQGAESSPPPRHGSAHPPTEVR